MNHVGRRSAILAKLMAKTAIVDRGHVINGVPSPCHEWTGPDSGTGRGGGYGRVSIDGQTCAVHLVAAAHYFGYVPGKKQVDHRCNNRRCWNPEHLQIVTHKRNQKLRDQRKRAST